MYGNRKVALGIALVVALLKVTEIFPVLSDGNYYFSLTHNRNAQLVIEISLPGILNTLFSLRRKNDQQIQACIRLCHMYK